MESLFTVLTTRDKFADAILTGRPVGSLGPKSRANPKALDITNWGLTARRVSCEQRW